MKKTTLIILALILIIGGIVCYNKFIKNKVINNNPIFGKTQVMVNNKKITEGGKNYTIDITYPLVDVKFVDEDMNKLINEQISQFKTDIGTEVISPNWQNTLFINYEVINNSDSLLSLKFDVELFTGGAHPNHFIITRNYDLDTERIITLWTILENQEGLNKVSLITLDYFKHQQLEYDLFTDGLGAKKENYERFNLTKDSVIFYFPEYQIAPYVAGSQQIEIKLNDLKK